MRRLALPFNRNQWTLVGVSFLLGVFWVFAMRFVLMHDPSTHYHANFAVVVNGQRDSFEGDQYYEEIALCTADDQDNNPRHRVHLHDKVSHVAHVHDAAATWGHLMANLGYVLGNDVLQTRSGLYQDGMEGKKLVFVLNGERVLTAANRLIESKDSLLIYYGEDNQAAIDAAYAAITRDAADYNERTDPSACSGGEPTSLTQRLKHAVSF